MPNGRMSAQGRADRDSIIPHSRAFDIAFQQALDEITQDSSGFAPGQYTVNVTFQADITVTNPGRVDSYVVNIDPAT
jgi:hypothetical protein